MSKSQKILKWSLFAGAVYFFLVSLAHMIGIKIPMLFIYFSVPSYVYQDRIISFLTFGWAIFLFSGFMNPKKNKGTIKSALIAGYGAVIGLCVINIFTDFHELSKDINISIFWLETIFLFAYLVWLTALYNQTDKLGD